MKYDISKVNIKTVSNSALSYYNLGYLKQEEVRNSYIENYRELKSKFDKKKLDFIFKFQDSKYQKLASSVISNPLFNDEKYYNLLLINTTPKLIELLYNYNDLCKNPTYLKNILTIKNYSAIEMYCRAIRERNINLQNLILFLNDIDKYDYTLVYHIFYNGKGLSNLKKDINFTKKIISLGIDYNTVNVINTLYEYLKDNDEILNIICSMSSNNYLSNNSLSYGLKDLVKTFKYLFLNNDIDTLKKLLNFYYQYKSTNTLIIKDEIFKNMEKNPKMLQNKYFFIVLDYMFKIKSENCKNKRYFDTLAVDLFVDSCLLDEVNKNKEMLLLFKNCCNENIVVVLNYALENEFIRKNIKGLILLSKMPNLVCADEFKNCLSNEIIGRDLFTLKRIANLAPDFEAMLNYKEEYLKEYYKINKGVKKLKKIPNNC